MNPNRQTTSRARSMLLAALLSTCALMQTASASGERSHHFRRHTLIGTWEFEVDIGFIPPFPAVTTYTVGGSSIGTAGAHPPGRTVSGEFGIWRRTGRRTFKSVVQSYQLVDGVLFATFRRFQTLRLTGPDTVEGEFTSEVIFPGSDPIPGNTGKVKGKRLRFE